MNIFCNKKTCSLFILLATFIFTNVCVNGLDNKMDLEPLMLAEANIKGESAHASTDKHKSMDTTSTDSASTVEHTDSSIHSGTSAHDGNADHGEHGQASSDHGGHHGVHLDGANVSLWWGLPFLGILLSIAIFPLLASHTWHHHYGKISLFWWLSFVIPFTIHFGFDVGLFYLLEVYLGEFIPFIVLLLALFTIAGGVRLTGDLQGSPKVNTGILLLGTILASWMGTTGAAMLLIRPLIRANSWRKYQVHSVVFFIFLVANIGGSLTPLGDPPLFLGFLKGVSFFWTTQHLIAPMIVLSVILLVLYYVVDTVLYKKETNKPKATSGEKLGLEGTGNLILLLGVIGAVVMSGLFKSKISNPDDVIFTAYHTGLMTWGVFLQIIILLGLTFASLKITKKSTREGNEFTWEPILEVGKLFATIFITMVPVIAILKAGTDGSLAAVVSKVTGPDGPINSMYFWATGILSAFLDNAPTYVVFFNTAGGDAVELMGPMAQTLMAISCGAVFMGALSYIGNAPNFMVKAIAEQSKIKMPSFFGYMLWSFGILIPCFLLLTFIFF